MPDDTRDPDAPPVRQSTGLSANGSDDWIPPLPSPLAGRTPTPAPGADRHPEHAGRFRVAGEIARGGMGAVLRAYDAELDRDIAVKVLLPALADRPAVARRFLDEARVAGRLQHPGLVPVHAVGALPDGRPYFAMKLVEGRTLAALLRDRTGEHPGPPPVTRFVAVFEQVCQAVAYAHSRGVVHRDLKPQNVMVGAFGEVQVMDWGLAKELTSPERERSGEAVGRAAPPEPVGTGDTTHGLSAGLDTDHTAPGSVLGTPAYLAPEQARGEPVDRRADVFGLGAVLCETLTGHPPFGGGSAAEIHAAAGRADTTAARDRLAACGADPELIALCGRCLAADPADRPADAGEVAAAVAALRAAAEERARRAEQERAAADARAEEQRRKRRWQLAVAAAAVLLVAVTGVAGVLVERQAAARRRLEADREAAELRDQVEGGRRAEADRQRVVRNAAAVAALVDRCEGALRSEDGAPAAAALAELDRRAGEDGAEGFRLRIERCRVALALLRDLDRVDGLRWTSSAGKPWHTAGEIAGEWASTFRRHGIAPGPTPVGQVADRVKASLLGDRLLAALDLWFRDDPRAELLDALRAADPDPFRDSVRAAILAADRDAYAALADRPEALAQPPHFAVVLASDHVSPGRQHEILRGVLLNHPRRFDAMIALCLSYPPGVREYAGERLRWAQAALATRPDNPTANQLVGISLAEAGRLDEAVAVHQRAARLTPDSAPAHFNLGNALGWRGDWAGAAGAFREAVRLDPRHPPGHFNLAMALGKSGDRDGAIASFRVAIRLNPSHALAHANLGIALYRKGDLPGAGAALREAVRLAPDEPTPHHFLGQVLQDSGDLGGAIAAYRAAAHRDPKDAVARNNLGLALHDKGDFAGAAAAYRDALRVDPALADTAHNLALALWDGGDLNGAEAAFREAVRLDPKNARAIDSLGYTLATKGDTEGAIRAFREAVRADPGYAAARRNLGVALVGVGDLDGAIDAYGAAVKLDPADDWSRRQLTTLLARRAADRVAPPPREVWR